MSKTNSKKIIIIMILISVCYGFFFCFVILFPYISYKLAKVEINTDINRYNDFIGKQAKEQYRNKWDMDEEIFPLSINDNMNVIDYKMVYYNPWDAQYLSYLIVEYNNTEYKQELARLKNYKSTKYIGYYGVTGFSKYRLLAMYADSYNGFVYAIDKGQNQIIYVELIFCNYFYDLDYYKYINADYLPDNFDATLNNNYSKQMIK